MAGKGTGLHGPASSTGQAGCTLRSVRTQPAAGLRAEGRLRNDCEPLPTGTWVLDEIKGDTGPFGRSSGDSRMLGVWTQQDSGSCSTVSKSDFVQWVQNLKKKKKFFCFNYMPQRMLLLKIRPTKDGPS